MKAGERDIHVLRYFSSFVSVSRGRVINVTDPTLAFCPLASHLYKGFKDVVGSDREAVKRQIKKVIEAKIAEYGFFTPKRKLSHGDAAIPYGASEMLMFALKKKVIDVAVVVCDGVGTVVTDSGDVVQGIGARMNSLLLTSPIDKTRERLKKLGCRVVFDHALIDQSEGVKAAIQQGHKRIAVTVGGHDTDKLKEIRQWESSGGVAVTILVVCTTGVTGDRVEKIRRDADLVWSCAAWEIRQEIGSAALLQISKQIPVFALTQRGIDLFASIAQDGAPLGILREGEQYLISQEPGGYEMRLGRLRGFLREEKLPVLSDKSFVMAGV
jgi:putative methanogenesis marker protein 8